MIPKYRAWDKENDQMLFPDDTDKIYFEITVDGIVTYDMNHILPDGTFTILDTVLMQSTGFHDKNGKEIFVGDIVIHTQKSINYGDVYHHSYAEVFQQQNGAYRIRGKDIYGADAYGARKNLKVVGNIYEHAELLNKDRFMTED
ncbi:YopX family protein [Enterococcus avium]|uniref:YopX family protein n=1 Tax=Enterococcus avium TaxID=33945 RepID=UPI0035CA6BAC